MSGSDQTRTFHRLVLLGAMAMLVLVGIFLLTSRTGGHDMSNMTMPSEGTGMRIVNMQLTATAQAMDGRSQDMPEMDMSVSPTEDHASDDR